MMRSSRITVNRMICEKSCTLAFPICIMIGACSMFWMFQSGMSMSDTTEERDVDDQSALSEGYRPLPT